MRKFLISGAALLVANLSGCGSDSSSSSSVSEGGTSSVANASGSTNSTLDPGASGGNSSTTVGGVISLPKSPYSGALMINELCPSNKSGALDEGGSYADWLELYNATSADMPLGDFCLSTTLDDLCKGKLSSSLTIAAGGVLLLWADDDLTQGVLHLPFKLSAKGVTVYLSDPEEKLIDSVQVGAATSDATYSRLPDGTGAFAWCSWGTPNKLNGSACATN